MVESADIVCFGELLWDLLPTGKVAGGAPFNIANRVKAFGLKSEVITSIGADDLGNELIKLVEKKGNSSKYIQIHPSLPTSTVQIEVGEGGEPRYKIVHPVAWDDIKLTDKMIELVKNAKMFVYSSLGIRDARSRKVLFDLLPHANIKVCDINLREGQYTKETILKMLEHADILRMNEHELNMASKWLNLDIDSFEDGVIKIAALKNYQAVVATLGGDGAMSYRNGQFYKQAVFPVTVRDTVGAGDAFLASYLVRLINGDHEKEALKYACAIGALTASKNGGTPDITNQEISDMISY